MEKDTLQLISYTVIFAFTAIVKRVYPSDVMPQRHIGLEVVYLINCGCLFLQPIVAMFVSEPLKEFYAFASSLEPSAPSSTAAQMRAHQS